MKEQIDTDPDVSVQKRMLFKNKKSAIYLFTSFILLTVLSGAVFFIPAYAGSSLLILKLCQVADFLLLGIIYTFILNGNATVPGDETVKQKWLYTACLSVCMCGTIFILYFFSGRLAPMFALSSCSIFLLPFILTQAWYFYRNIPVTNPKSEQIQTIQQKSPELEIYNDVPEVQIAGAQENLEKKVQELENINRQEKEMYESKLRQEIEKIKKENDTYKNSLKDQEEKNRREKEVYENKLREMEKIKEDNDALQLQQASIAPGDKSKQEEDQDQAETSTRHQEESVDPTIKNSEAGPIKNKEKTWFYTVPLPGQPPVVFLNSVQIYISLAVKKDETEEELFSIFAPLEINLGEFFNYFLTLKRKNKKPDIDIYNDDQNSFTWKFYAKGMMGMRQLDPALSLRRNHVKEMGIITARRS